MADTSKITSLKKLSEFDMNVMISESENIAKELKNQLKGELKMAQIRKFHGHITKIWSKYSTNKSYYSKDSAAFKKEIKDEIFFVKAYLAYQAGREPKIGYLKDILTAAIDKIQDHKDFETFKKFYDSILAYYKFYSSQASSESPKGGNRG